VVCDPKSVNIEELFQQRNPAQNSRVRPTDPEQCRDLDAALQEILGPLDPQTQMTLSTLEATRITEVTSVVVKESKPFHNPLKGIVSGNLKVAVPQRRS